MIITIEHIFSKGDGGTRPTWEELQKEEQEDIRSFISFNLCFEPQASGEIEASGAEIVAVEFISDGIQSIISFEDGVMTGHPSPTIAYTLNKSVDPEEFRRCVADSYMSFGPKSRHINNETPYYAEDHQGYTRVIKTNQTGAQQADPKQQNRLFTHIRYDFPNGIKTEGAVFPAIEFAEYIDTPLETTDLLVSYKNYIHSLCTDALISACSGGDELIDGFLKILDCAKPILWNVDGSRAIVWERAEGDDLAPYRGNALIIDCSKIDNYEDYESSILFKNYIEQHEHHKIEELLRTFLKSGGEALDIACFLSGAYLQNQQQDYNGIIEYIMHEQDSEIWNEERSHRMICREVNEEKLLQLVDSQNTVQYSSNITWKHPIVINTFAKHCSNKLLATSSCEYSVENYR